MKKNKILFIKEEDFISTIQYVGKEEHIYSLKSEANSLAKKHLFSISEYRKICNKQLKLKYNIPIYFSPSLLLFYIKTKKARYLINYFNILKICYMENIIIIFKEGHILEIDVKRKNMLAQLKKIEYILDYKNKVE